MVSDVGARTMSIDRARSRTKTVRHQENMSRWVINNLNLIKIFCYNHRTDSLPADLRKKASIVQNVKPLELGSLRFATMLLQ